MAELPGFSLLLQTIARLRAPDGCPWDRKQTTESMAPCLLEEAFEASDALRRSATEDSKEELGDVLVNVAMISQIAAEDGRFGADEVARHAAERSLSFVSPSPAWSPCSTESIPSSPGRPVAMMSPGMSFMKLLM